MAKCYGGPLHGKFVEFKGLRLNAVITPHVRPRWSCDLDILDMPQVNEVSYYRQQFAEQRRNPDRHRTIDVVILEGAELTPRERWEIEDDMMKVPWQFPSVSILNQFDEWFSQAAYRHFGVLRWKGQRVYE